MKISVTKENLMEPNYEWVKNGLENLIEFFSGKNIEFVCQPKFSALNCFLHPELHEESIVFLVKHRFFQELTFSCGYQEFSLRDYFFPTFPKIRKIFSAVINFAKFREEFVLFLKNFSKFFEKLFYLSLEKFIQTRFIEGKIFFLNKELLRKKFKFIKAEKTKKLLKNFIVLRKKLFFQTLKVDSLSSLKFRNFTGKILSQKKKDYLFTYSEWKISFSSWAIRFPMWVFKSDIEGSFFGFFHNLVFIKNLISQKFWSFVKLKISFGFLLEISKKLSGGKTKQLFLEKILKAKIVNRINSINKKNIRVKRLLLKKRGNEIIIRAPEILLKINKLLFVTLKKFRDLIKKIKERSCESFYNLECSSFLVFIFLIDSGIFENNTILEFSSTKTK